MSEHTQEEEAEMIYIPEEDGSEQAYEVVMKFELDETGQKYMMVVPVDEDEEEPSDEVFAFRYEEDDDAEDLKLYAIEDEEEWNIVEETFNTLISELEE